MLLGQETSPVNAARATSLIFKSKTSTAAPATTTTTTATGNATAEPEAEEEGDEVRDYFVNYLMSFSEFFGKLQWRICFDNDYFGYTNINRFS